MVWLVGLKWWETIRPERHNAGRPPPTLRLGRVGTADWLSPLEALDLCFILDRPGRAGAPSPKPGRESFSVWVFWAHHLLLTAIEIAGVRRFLRSALPSKPRGRGVVCPMPKTDESCQTAMSTAMLFCKLSSLLAQAPPGLERNFTRLRDRSRKVFFFLFVQRGWPLGTGPPLI